MKSILISLMLVSILFIGGCSSTVDNTSSTSEVTKIQRTEGQKEYDGLMELFVKVNEVDHLNYFIVETKYQYIISEMVTECMSKGWEPLGGVDIIVEDSLYKGHYYLQAMIRTTVKKKGW